MLRLIPKCAFRGIIQSQENHLPILRTSVHFLIILVLAASSAQAQGRCASELPREMLREEVHEVREEDPLEVLHEFPRKTAGEVSGESNSPAAPAAAAVPIPDAASVQRKQAVIVKPVIVEPVITKQVIVKQVIVKQVIDKKFIAVMASLGGAESLRFTAHKLVLDHEYAAGAPWVTSVPRDQNLIARCALIFAAELVVAYELKKPHSWLPGDKVIRKFWWAYPGAATAIHVKNGVGSIRTKAPAGCPPELCGEQ